MFFCFNAHTLIQINWFLPKISIHFHPFHGAPPAIEGKEPKVIGGFGSDDFPFQLDDF